MLTIVNVPSMVRTKPGALCHPTRPPSSLVYYHTARNWVKRVFERGGRRLGGGGGDISPSWGGEGLGYGGRVGGKRKKEKKVQN